jgi:hypothetical protein
MPDLRKINRDPRPAQALTLAASCGESPIWMVATHIAQPTPKEMEEKMKEQMASQQAARAAPATVSITSQRPSRPFRVTTDSEIRRSFKII